MPPNYEDQEQDEAKRSEGKAHSQFRFVIIFQINPYWSQSEAGLILLINIFDTRFSAPMVISYPIPIVKWMIVNIWNVIKAT